MKVLVACFVYNERKYLPPMIDWYTGQGCDMLILDNMSDDGTWEYLIDDCKCKGDSYLAISRISTDGAFDLRVLQAELCRKIAFLQPDWVVYVGADFYFIFDAPLPKLIQGVDCEGYNQIAVRHYTVFNTGEERGLPLQNYYFWAGIDHDLVMISKYEEGFKIEADQIHLLNPKVKKVEGISLNYGQCKPAEEREITFQRRQLAWERGMTRGWGFHYLENKQRGWIHDRKNLVYLPETSDWKWIQKIIV